MMGPHLQTSELQIQIEELEERRVPGTLMISTSSGMTFSNSLNDRVIGHLSVAQEHSGGVVTWIPS